MYHTKNLLIFVLHSYGLLLQVTRLVSCNMRLVPATLNDKKSFLSVGNAKYMDSL